MYIKNFLGLNNSNLKEFGKSQRFRRALWGYVAIAFNQVDNHRLEQVGPDRLCAEWVLKNGGAVKFKELPNILIRDYNILPPESQKLHVKVVDASDASLMKIGLEHFKGCNHIEAVIFHNCKHLEADGLTGLRYLAKSLQVLQVSSCDNINDEGLKILGDLQLNNLTCLAMFDMRYVKDINAVAKELKAKMPKCEIKIVDK